VTRDVERLAQQPYDLLVIGGGIHGLFAAYDAATRGMSVALVERADFGSGLSFNHQRTIHGGLRMLQNGRVLRSRRDMAERRTWAHIAPHYLRPLPFLIGTYRWTRRSRWMLKAGFALYDRLSRHRNSNVPAELHLPKPRLESAAATRRLFPGIADRGLTGGAVWYDYQMRHPDRLTWSVALAAAQAGATLANYVEAVGPLRAQGRITGARVIDRLSGQSHDVAAKVTLLGAGSAMPRLMTAFGVAGAPAYLRAMNLLLDRPARDIATVAAGPRGGMLTAVPWSGYLLVGTHQSTGAVPADETEPPEAALEACLADVNATFASLRAARADIRVLHHGVVPAVVRGARAELLSTPIVLAHRSGGAPGLVSMVGVKYTSARAVAERAVDAAAGEISRGRGRSRTASTALPHAGVADVEGRLVETLREIGIGLDRDVIDHLTGWYGTEAPDVVRHGAMARLLDRLDPQRPVLAAEVDYAVFNAQAVHLADVVLRRTPLGSAGHPGREALERAAGVMAARLGWTPERIADEIAQVERVYPPK
jgi:glycerol-3-phosphate dehydrogenase